MTTPREYMNQRRGEYPLWEATLPVLSVASFGPEDEELGPRQPQAEPDPLAQAMSAAEEVLEAARHEASQIVSEAREQAEDIRQTTRAAAVEAVAGEQTQAFEHAITVLRDELAAAFVREMERIETEAVRLCIDLAQGVIHKKIEQDDTVVVEVVRAGLEKLNGARDLTIRINPECEEALSRGRVELASQFPSAASVQVKLDEVVGPGGALIHSANGDVDLQIETQLERLRRAAHAVLAEIEQPGPQEDPS